MLVSQSQGPAGRRASHRGCRSFWAEPVQGGPAPPPPRLWSPPGGQWQEEGPPCSAARCPPWRESRRGGAVGRGGAPLCPEGTLSQLQRWDRHLHAGDQGSAGGPRTCGEQPTLYRPPHSWANKDS